MSAGSSAATENTAAANGPQLTTTHRDAGLDSAVSAARRLVDALLRTGDHSTADMDAIAGQLNHLADDLDTHAPHLEERLTHMWAGEGVTRHDPATGPENAIAPPLSLTGNPDGSVSGVLTLGVAYQGPPGYVHGGVSALLLDHTLGVANYWAGESGMTAELTLRYKRATPLFEPLTVTGRQVSVAGRKIYTSGTITADGHECVTAEGLFIATDPTRPR